MPLAADAEIDKATGPKQGIGRQVAAFHAPELHAMWAIETTQVSMAHIAAYLGNCGYS